MVRDGQVRKSLDNDGKAACNSAEEENQSERKDVERHVVCMLRLARATGGGCRCAAGSMRRGSVRCPPAEFC